MGNNNGKMALSMKEIGLKIKWKDKDFIIWPIKVLIVVCGKTINFTEKVYK
jgi:hypothetical protein